MHEDDLTAVEKEKLEALSKERVPSPLLEERVVNELRERGLLRPAGRRTIEVTRWRVTLAAAASVLLLVGGFVLGRWIGPQPSEPVQPAVVEASDLALAASLQRAGTAYVSAIEQLALSEGSPNSEEMRQGREVALTTLYTAANEVTKMVPKEHLAAQFLLALDATATTTESENDGQSSERMIWF